MISTIPSCALHWHVTLHCTKWPPELKIESSCLALTGQTTGWISTKLYRSDQYHPKLCTSSARSPPQHKNGRQSYKYKNLVQLSQVKLLVGFQ
jgi:hypothetical protein